MPNSATCKIEKKDTQEEGTVLSLKVRRLIGKFLLTLYKLSFLEEHAFMPYLPVAINIMV